MNIFFKHSLLWYNTLYKYTNRKTYNLFGLTFSSIFTILLVVFINNMIIDV